MKKIKGILLFGILTLLGIGSSFGATYHGGNSVFKYIAGVDSEYLTTLNIFDHGYSNVNPGFTYSYGSRILNSSSWGLFNGNSFIFTNFNTSSFPFSLQNFYSSGGLEFFGSSGSSFISLNTGNSLLFSRTVDYSTWDSFPLIYDLLGNYLTFSGDNFIVYNGNSFPITNVNFLQYCFYGDGFSLSCLFSTDANDLGFKFKSFLVSSTGNIDTYDNFAIIPIGYDTTNNGKITSQDMTLVLSYGNYNDMQNLGIIYNLYNCYSSDPEYLKTCNLNSKGYFNINSSDFFHRRFLSVYNNNSIYGYGSFSSIYYTNGNFYFTSNGYGFETTNQNDFYQGLHFGRSEILDYFYNDDSVENILLNQGTPSTTTNISGTTVNNLLINCLGPTYNTPDGLPPSYCYGPDGNLQNDILENCYTTFVYEGNNEYSTHYFCNFGGVIEEVSFIPEGSGVQITPCTGDSCGYWGSLQFEDIGGYSEEYFTGYLNGGYFFKCPFPYTNKLVIWPKLINLLDGLDVALPINCALAGYYEGSKVVSFTNSGHLLSSPLLNGEGENRELLYRFFDLFLILGGVFLFGKIFKNFN